MVPHQEGVNAVPTVYITSDPHFGHDNIMKFCGRSLFMTDRDRGLFMDANADATGEKMRLFRPSRESVQCMDDALIANINARVGRSDKLWCLGDWAMFNDRDKVGYYRRCKEIRNQIQCQNIYFVWGNHDGKRRQRMIGDLFSETFDQVQEKFGRAMVTFNHYPLISWNGQHHGSVDFPNVCLYGHVHNKNASPALLVFPKSWAALDCGFDSNEYQVWSLAEALEYLKPNLLALEMLKKESRNFDPFRGRSRNQGKEV